MAKVLIVEDSPLVVQMLTMVCQGAGHEVISFERFSAAADYLRQSLPDLILTDLNLPDVPGDDTLSELRAIEGVADTPVVIVSGRPSQELQEIARSSGAQGALSKDDGMPVISQQLPGLIDQLTG